MTIKVIPEVSGTLRVIRETELGYIKYIPDRQYPWECISKGILQYFETQALAMEHLLKNETK